MGAANPPGTNCAPSSRSRATEPERRGAPAGPHPADGRAPHRRAGRGARRDPVHPLAARAQPHRGCERARLRMPRRWRSRRRRSRVQPRRRRATDRGVVRVTASEIMGAEALPPIFAAFRARNPGIADRACGHQPQPGSRPRRRRHRGAHGPPDPERARRPPHRFDAHSALRSSRLSCALRRTALARRSRSIIA